MMTAGFLACVVVLQSEFALAVVSAIETSGHKGAEVVVTQVEGFHRANLSGLGPRG
jgi:hypothetical protein